MPYCPVFAPMRPARLVVSPIPPTAIAVLASLGAPTIGSITSIGPDQLPFCRLQGHSRHGRPLQSSWLAIIVVCRHMSVDHRRVASIEMPEYCSTIRRLDFTHPPAADNLWRSSSEIWARRCAAPPRRGDRGPPFGTPIRASSPAMKLAHCRLRTSGNSGDSRIAAPWPRAAAGHWRRLWSPSAACVHRISGALTRAP